MLDTSDRRAREQQQNKEHTMSANNDLFLKAEIDYRREAINSYFDGAAARRRFRAQRKAGKSRHTLPLGRHSAVTR
jgi:hypothetical protein